MKIFWSWQSDTHGKTGRHFVRECLVEAIATVNEPLDVDEPSEQERRDPIELDQDRVGVVGHPSLAEAIFKKIAAAAVFVADVTLVADLKVEPTDDNPDGIKRLINSNVAIEYGYAVGKLTDDATLLVMNLHHGALTKLPFDLGHKVAPCRYRLAPEASPADIAKAKKALTAQFVQTLRLHISRVTPPVAMVSFQPTPSTTNPAVFWQPGEVLARYGSRDPLRSMQSDDDGVYEYRFDESQALYLRLIPTVPRPEPFTFGKLMDIVERRRLRLMTRTFNGGMPYCNKHGAISYESSGTNLTPVALTQLHRNGEIWAVTREHWMPYRGKNIVAMINVENRIRECLENSIQVVHGELGIEPPYEVEMGVIGLRGMHLSRPVEPGISYVEQFSDCVYDDTWRLTKVLKDVTPLLQAGMVREFLKGVYALAAIDF